MASIKLENLYLSKYELKDVMQLAAKKEILRTIKINRVIDCIYFIFKKQSKNKRRIDDIKDELKNLTYDISKSESKDIKRTLYNIVKRNIVGSEKLRDI